MNTILFGGIECFTVDKSIQETFFETLGESEIVYRAKASVQVGINHKRNTLAMKIIPVNPDTFNLLTRLLQYDAIVPVRFTDEYYPDCCLKIKQFSTAQYLVFDIVAEIAHTTRIADMWFLEQALQDATVWSAAPVAAYDTRGTVAPAPTGFAIQGNGSSWNAAIIEQVSTTNSHIAARWIGFVGAAVVAAVGISQRSAWDTAKPLGANGVGIRFNNGTVQAVWADGTMSATTARTSGTYDVQIHSSLDRQYVLVFQNGVRLAFWNNHASHVHSNNEGLTMVAHTNSLISYAIEVRL